MANRYDNAQHYPEQYKLFKFFDLNTTDILKVIAQNEQQAKKILGRSSLIFIARFPLNRMPEYFHFTSLEGVNHE